MANDFNSGNCHVVIQCVNEDVVAHDAYNSCSNADYKATCGKIFKLHSKGFIAIAKKRGEAPAYI
eukprot:12241673-Heterocapsa_arctica.AAC.1